MPTLRQLEYLVAVADLHNFRRAADACNVSQPTLSQQLRALEDRLGVALIERRASGAEMTPIGREITARARRLIIEVQDIRELARRASEHIVGTLRFGVTPTLGPYLMPPIIAALHSEQPDLKLHIREGIPGEQALELSRGALDILLGPLPIGVNSAPEVLRSIKATPSRSSSAFICWLRVGCETWQASAARRKLWRSATATRYSS